MRHTPRAGGTPHRGSVDHRRDKRRQRRSKATTHCDRCSLPSQAQGVGRRDLHRPGAHRSAAGSMPFLLMEGPRAFTRGADRRLCRSCRDSPARRSASNRLEDLYLCILCRSTAIQQAMMLARSAQCTGPKCGASFETFMSACKQVAAEGLSHLAERHRADVLARRRRAAGRSQAAAWRDRGQRPSRRRVLDEWKFGEQLPYGRGVTALLHGPSGTGKTMAALAVAKQLGVQILRIDLSRVVSKYIGDTEKNIDRVFDDASASGAALLIDEADALLGKRSEVKDAHDRYANIEVAYLLQRMEAYEGLAILTTNLRQNLDAAFLRRLRFIIDFPRPDVEAREEIWRRCLPEESHALDAGGVPAARPQDRPHRRPHPPDHAAGGFRGGGRRQVNRARAHRLRGERGAREARHAGGRCSTLAEVGRRHERRRDPQGHQGAARTPGAGRPAPGKVFVGPARRPGCGAARRSFCSSIGSCRTRACAIASIACRPTFRRPPVVVFDNSLPLDLYYLVTVGTTPGDNEEALLEILGSAMQALQLDPELTGPAVGYEAVHVSLDPLTTEETSRIWALFPTANYRTSIAYSRARSGSTRGCLRPSAHPS